MKMTPTADQCLDMMNRGMVLSRIDVHGNSLVDEQHQWALFVNRLT